MTSDETPPVGSLGEEAVKLLAALGSWADDAGGTGENEAGSAARTPSGPRLWAELNEHVAGGQDCKYCPVCQLIALARATSPEARHHLGVAASSLLQAASALLATTPQQGRSEDTGVEHIHLSEDWEDD